MFSARLFLPSSHKINAPIRLGSHLAFCRPQSPSPMPCPQPCWAFALARFRAGCFCLPLGHPSTPLRFVDGCPFPTHKQSAQKTSQRRKPNCHTPPRGLASHPFGLCLSCPLLVSLPPCCNVAPRRNPARLATLAIILIYSATLHG